MNWAVADLTQLSEEAAVTATNRESPNPTP